MLCVRGWLRPHRREHIHCHDFRHCLCVNVRPHLRTYAERLAFCRSLGWKDTTMYDRVYGQSRDEVEVMADLAADVLLRAGVGVGISDGISDAGANRG